MEEQEVHAEEQEAPVDHNWRQANEVLSAQKRQIEDLQRKIEQMNQPKPELEVDEFADWDPDDFMTVSKAKEMAKKLASREATKAAKAVISEHMQQQTIANDELRMKSKHEDYDYVIENFAVPLIKNDPALAYKVQNSRNPAETAYKLGKLSDGYEALASQGTSARAEKVLKNTSRPVSANAVASPLRDQADSFSKMSREDVWKQSQSYANG